ncbi:MAG: M48 family metalloprotease [Planctomycetota bacterium]|nr:M48 family metalloprotease [Planctomycetota bacterium]
MDRHYTPLSPLPYQGEMVSYLRTREKAVWAWYAEDKQQAAYADAVRLELLKKTYRLDRQAHGTLYARGDEAARKLGIDVPLTFYQAQQDHNAINAAICCLPGEAHILLMGPILEVLSEPETGALLGHELGHYKLREHDGGQPAVADRILDAVASDSRAEPSHVWSALRFRQYAEIFADRCSYAVSGDLKAVVGCLVKTSTGSRDVNAESYLAQAEEIFSKGGVVTEGIVHPETFIRTRALSLWVGGAPDADARIREMIEGPTNLEKLDLLGQQALVGLTRRLIDALLSKRWIQSDPVLAQARLLFHDYAPPSAAAEDEALWGELGLLDKSARDYFCYILLDFASVDPSLEDLPLARALELAEKAGLRERMEEIANRELRISKKMLASLRKDGPDMLARAETA